MLDAALFVPLDSGMSLKPDMSDKTNMRWQHTLKVQAFRIPHGLASYRSRPPMVKPGLTTSWCLTDCSRLTQDTWDTLLAQPRANPTPPAADAAAASVSASPPPPPSEVSKVELTSGVPCCVWTRHAQRLPLRLLTLQCFRPFLLLQVKPSVAGVIEMLRQRTRDNPRQRLQVLVTGSLYLVGDVLRTVRRGLPV